MNTTDTVRRDKIGMAKNSALKRTYGPRKPKRHVTFKEEIELQRVRGYATIYGVHPSLKSTHNGMVQLQKPCNPYTSKSERVMTRRRMQQMRNAGITAHTHTTNAPTDEGA